MQHVLLRDESDALFQRLKVGVETCINVDLPEPPGPRMQMNSRGSTTMVTLSRIRIRQAEVGAGVAPSHKPVVARARQAGKQVLQPERIWPGIAPSRWAFSDQVTGLRRISQVLSGASQLQMFMCPLEMFI